MQFVGDVAQKARIGLMAFVAIHEGDNEDVDDLDFLGAGRKKIKACIGGICPLGKTPIERFLALDVALLKEKQPSEVPKSGVRVSDDVEIRDGDPRVTAAVSPVLGSVGCSPLSEVRLQNRNCATLGWAHGHRIALLAG